MVGPGPQRRIATTTASRIGSSRHSRARSGAARSAPHRSGGSPTRRWPHTRMPGRLARHAARATVTWMPRLVRQYRQPEQRRRRRRGTARRRSATTAACRCSIRVRQARVDAASHPQHPAVRARTAVSARRPPVAATSRGAGVSAELSPAPPVDPATSGLAGRRAPCRHALWTDSEPVRPTTYRGDAPTSDTPPSTQGRTLAWLPEHRDCVLIGTHATAGARP